MTALRSGWVVRPFSIGDRRPTLEPIVSLDAVPPLERRSSFRLSADSLTGQGPTSETCTYLPDSDVLACVVDTAGHGSESDELDGLIPPGSKKAIHGHDGGDGHDGERGTVPCVHRLEIRQIFVLPTDVPAVDPEPEVTPARRRWLDHRLGLPKDVVGHLVRQWSAPVLADLRLSERLRDEVL